MTVTHVELLVEEPSMQAALECLLPGILEGLEFSVHPFQCKNDLLSSLPSRLLGYSKWLPPDWRIVVLVDRDNDDCRELKRRLEEVACKSGLRTRSSVAGGAYQLVNRVVIEELEAWYFGDWAAVRKAYPRAPERIPSKAAYRDPDAIQGGTWERFERIMRKAGYFKAGLRKTDAARAIMANLDPDANTSRSFQVLRNVLREIASQQ